MAERQFSRLNQAGLSRPLEDVYAYQQGTGAIRPPGEYFGEGSQAAKDFDEMLARLLTESQYRSVVAGWTYPEKDDASGGKNQKSREALAETLFVQDPTAAAMFSRGSDPYPTYVNRPAGKHWTYNK